MVDPIEQNAMRQMVIEERKIENKKVKKKIKADRVPTLLLASPMRQMAFKEGTQRAISAIQLLSVDLGTMTRWGEAMFKWFFM